MRKLQLITALLAAVSINCCISWYAMAEVTKDPSLEVVSSQLGGKKRDKKLTGTITNKGKETLHNVEVRYNLFAGDQFVREEKDSTDTLGPNANWNFRIQVSDKVTRFELTSLTSHPDKDDDKD